ncbi:MAG: hypothetical protein D3910_08000, partial [Candidatus Electrothrix sp. ATG2]|nr:hypothetical protein [Candidatus Electrothrix sp. ATG2]
MAIYIHHYRITILIYIGIFTLAFFSGYTQAQPQPCYDHSLRLMTYNLAVLATMNSNEDIFGKDDRIRVNMIADKILQKDHDVVVFQEVFHDDAKDELAKKLYSKYPYVVYKLDAADLDQDSGLMLFSRYPFAPLPKDTFKGDDVIAISSFSIWNDVAFIEFDDHQGYDSWANKGVGLVRIEIPCTDDRFTVVFTHLQATYGKDSPWERDMSVALRRIQLFDIQKIIKGTLTEEQIAKERLYLMGDLNINGNLFNMEQLAWSGKSEWTERFNSGGFFATVLKDSWAFQTSPDDPGQTAGSGFPFFPGGKEQGERLDYIFYNPSANTYGRQLCRQHLRKAWELADDDGGHHYTDHFAVEADTNIWAPRCNPLDPYVVNPQPDETVSGHITYPGSMQWYRIEESGSYSIMINAGGSNVKFDVYKSDDLSRPVPNYHGEAGENGLKFVMPEAPFYVRVFSPDRSWQGPYSIKFHKHQGKAAWDSITLRPARLDTYKIPTMPLNPENAVWYDFRTDVSDNNKYPELQFSLKYLNSSKFTFELRDVNQERLSESSDITVSPTPSSFHTLLMDRSDLPKGKYYLKVLPQITNPSGHEFSIEWRTTL